MFRRFAKAAACCIALASAWPSTCRAAADDDLLRPQFLGAQYTRISQHLSRFGALYSGPNSLNAAGDTQSSNTFGLFTGIALTRHLQFYFDVEVFKGAGISNSSGMGGLTNGDVIRQGSIDLAKDPYIERAYLRYIVPLGELVPFERARDQLPGMESARQIEIKFGRYAVNDDFDVNRYANSTRAQFMNWGLFNNTAWDFAADTRGYTNGVAAVYNTEAWSLRAGIFQMPVFANGNVLDRALGHSRGENIELTWRMQPQSTVLRVLAYRNKARMGVYRDAITQAAAQGTVPNIAADDRAGREKYGIGVNVEQPLADDGETGLFARLGLSDGKTESFAFTEVDRHLSFGAQMAGNRWRRTQDRLGVGIALHGLSRDHRDYLAAGGRGFLLGDGQLSYGVESIFEAYYRIQIGKYVQLSPDWQFIRNPGYNRDRGPARVAGLRLHIEY